MRLPDESQFSSSQQRVQFKLFSLVREILTNINIQSTEEKNKQNEEEKKFHSKKKK